MVQLDFKNNSVVKVTLYIFKVVAFYNENTLIKFSSISVPQ